MRAQLEQLAGLGKGGCNRDCSCVDMLQSSSIMFDRSIPLLEKVYVKKMNT